MFLVLTLSAILLAKPVLHSRKVVMHINDVLGIFGAIIVLAIVATVVASSNTSGIIKAWTDGFANDVSAAKGTH